MITKSKTFYMSAMTLNLLRESEKTVLSCSSLINDEFNERFTISWEEEEPKITISESEFDVIFTTINYGLTWSEFKHELNRKLFNKGE